MEYEYEFEFHLISTEFIFIFIQIKYSFVYRVLFESILSKGSKSCGKFKNCFDLKIRLKPKRTIVRLLQM